MDDNPALYIFLVGLILSLLATYLTIILSRKIGFLDRPKIERHKAHKEPVPLAGGISLIITLGFIMLFFQEHWPDLGIANPYFLIGMAVIFLVGLLDDIIIFSAPVKMVGQIIGAVLIIIAGFSIDIFESSILNNLVSLFWFVGIINAFNFLDGSDGMILESGIIITGAVAIFTNLSGQTELHRFSIVLIGLLIGLLAYNYRPARMFMGDAGSQLLGLLLATIVLKYNPLGFDPASSWITPILMMSIPIFDVTLVVVSRLRRKIPVMTGGLDHTYHRLVQKGLQPHYATLIIVIGVLITNSLAHLTLVINREFAYLIFALVIMSGVLLLLWLEKTYQHE